MPHIWMSHVTTMNESWHAWMSYDTCGWAPQTCASIQKYRHTHTHTRTHTHKHSFSHTQVLVATTHQSHMNESYHTMRHATHDEPCHTHPWLLRSNTCPTWTSHVTRNESCHSSMSHVKHIHGSHHTHTWVMPHRYMTTHTNHIPVTHKWVMSLCHSQSVMPHTSVLPHGWGVVRHYRG